MVEKIKEQTGCQICDTFSTGEMWQCECGFINLPKDKFCRKCGRPRVADAGSS